MRMYHRKNQIFLDYPQCDNLLIISHFFDILWSKYSYKHGIEIDKNLILLISNNIVPEGKDKLIIYDRRKRENIYELEGYPYNISKNSLFLMKNRDYKKVLCACIFFLNIFHMNAP